MNSDIMESSDNLAKKEKETDIIKRSLRSTYDHLDEKLSRQVVRETIFAPHSRKIDIGGQKISASDLRYQVANTIENLGSGKTLEQVNDLQMMIAHSIETINSETSSSQEYFRWLDDTTDILKHMNDGFVSQEDLNERNEFLDMSNQREAELMVCLGLYQSSQHPEAEEKAKLIRFKLQKLREMRSAIENRTRNKADVEISRAEYDMAIPYYKLYKGLAKLPFGYDVSNQQKRDLGICHDDDDDMEVGYSFYDHLLETVLDQMQEEDASYISREYQLAYDLSRQNNKTKIQEISDKMQELSGRKNSFRVNYAILEARQHHL